MQLSLRPRKRSNMVAEFKKLGTKGKFKAQVWAIGETSEITRYLQQMQTMQLIKQTQGITE